ncbi:MAG TPA: nuclease-related domain-containing protein [Streptosporangiaceae bacterium]|nr:nuclease-related domain-containing protein [Streptosporangiaceae bacterium]
MDREPGPDTEGTGPQAPFEPWADEGGQEKRSGRGRASGARTSRPARGVVPVPRPVLGGLADDPRLPIWIARAVMAIVAGVAITAWQGWRLGLTAAAFVAIADTVYRSRTTSVIPAGARLSSAQRRTGRRLFLLRPHGYVELRSRAIPGSDAVIDHLVIGPGGVFALDSERWDRRLPVRSVTGDLLYHGPFSQKARLEHARWEASRAAARLSDALGEKITVRPAMVIYGPTIPWIVASLNGVDVFSGKRLRKYFRRQARTRRGGQLDAEQVEDIHIAAAVALPPAR